MLETDSRKTAPSPEKYVLVVDSDPRSLVFMSMIIERFKYRACTALGVGNALEIISSSSPSAVITELNLKGLNGLDLQRRIRDKPERNNLPVIFMSGELTGEIKQQCRQAGATGFLEKPVQVHELYEAIHPLMEPESRRRHIRIQTRLSVTVNNRSLDCVEGECATNLSVNGLYLRTVNSYPLHAAVLIGIALNGREIQAEARVVYCELPGDDQKLWGVGLQFLKTSPQAGEIIRTFINDEVSHGIDPDLE